MEGPNTYLYYFGGSLLQREFSEFSANSDLCLFLLILLFFS